MIAEVSENGGTLTLTPTESWLRASSEDTQLMTAAAIYGMWKNYRNQAPVEIVMLDATGDQYVVIRDEGKAVRGSPSPTRRPAARLTQAFGDGPTASLRGGTVSFTARFSSTAAPLRGPQCSLSPGSWSGGPVGGASGTRGRGPGLAARDPGSRARQACQHRPRARRRGRRPAAVGNCIACHTVPGGEAFAGGLAVPTQFGTELQIQPTSSPTRKPASAPGARRLRARHARRRRPRGPPSLSGLPLRSLHPGDPGRQQGALRLLEDGRIGHFTCDLWSNSHSTRPGGAARLIAAQHLATPVPFDLPGTQSQLLGQRRP